MFGGEPECSEKEVVVDERSIPRAAVGIVDGGGWEDSRRRQNFDHGTETPTSDRPFSSTLSTNYQALLRVRQWEEELWSPATVDEVLVLKVFV